MKSWHTAREKKTAAKWKPRSVHCLDAADQKIVKFWSFWTDRNVTEGQPDPLSRSRLELVWGDVRNVRGWALAWLMINGCACFIGTILYCDSLHLPPVVHQSPQTDWQVLVCRKGSSPTTRPWTSPQGWEGESYQTLKRPPQSPRPRSDSGPSPSPRAVRWPGPSPAWRTWPASTCRPHPPARPGSGQPWRGSRPTLSSSLTDTRTECSVSGPAVVRPTITSSASPPTARSSTLRLSGWVRLVTVSADLRAGY